MTTTLTDDPEFTCTWCDRRAVDRAVFPACSERCKREAAAYRERSLRRWRLFP